MRLVSKNLISETSRKSLPVNPKLEVVQIIRLLKRLLAQFFFLRRLTLTTLINDPETKTWSQASIYNENDESSQRSWAWTLWTIDFTPEVEGEYEICVRAQDSNCNTQPESPVTLWNVRGLCNNSWHRIKLNGFNFYRTFFGVFLNCSHHST